jgi:hypothetical protein
MKAGRFQCRHTVRSFRLLSHAEDSDPSLGFNYLVDDRWWSSHSLPDITAIFHLASLFLLQRSAKHNVASSSYALPTSLPLLLLLNKALVCRPINTISCRASPALLSHAPAPTFATKSFHAQHLLYLPLVQTSTISV